MLISIKKLADNKTLIFALLLLLVFTVYRHAIVEIPRRDQAIFFIPEFAKKDFSLSNINKALFYSKLREKGPGDYFLFRPLTTFSLFLLDYFFRENLVLIGLLSLLLHTTCCFLIYLIGRQYLTPLLAAFIALAGVVQFPGLEAIYFRHILPYLMGFILWLLAIYLYLKKNREKYFKLGALILLASLFHEAFAIVVMGLFVLVERKEKKYIALFSLVYLGGYFLDWYFHRPPSFWGVKDSQELSVIAGLLITAKNFQHHITSWLTPYLLSFDFYPKVSQFFLTYAYDSWDVLNVSIFVVFFSVLATCFFKQKDPSIKKLIYLNGGYIFVIIVFMGVGRGMQRGDVYLQASSYYIYYTFYSFLILFILAMRNLSLVKPKAHFMFKGMAIYAVICAVTGYFSLQKFFSQNSSAAMSTANIVQEIKSRIENKPVCIEGYSQSLAQLQLPVLLSNFDCSVNQKSTVLNVILNSDLSLALVETNVSQPRTILLENRLRL